MKLFKFNIKIFIAFLICLMQFSCGSDTPIENSSFDTDGYEELALTINVLGASVSTSSEDKVEKIRSLRIIIIDSEGNLEVNETANLGNSEYIASNFSYTFKKALNGHDKHIYLIGNEESVGKIGITDNSELPENLPLGSLTGVLDYFISGSEINNVRAGKIFEKVLNSIYYENNYEEVSDEITGETVKVTDDNSIYLPYSAYYELGKNELGFSRLNNPLFLVPIATKIDFDVVSYRSHDTEIRDIVVCDLNKTNFINAQLREKEKIRIHEDKKLWWVDWLEVCSRNSHTAEDLEEFNNKWGWIEEYYIPFNEAPSPKSLHSDTENAEDWFISRMIDKNNPDRIHLGPFYLPESLNSEYSLTFRVYDTSSKEETILEGYKLDTVKAFFRNTHIIIQVELYEKAMDIYAEIVPWTKKVFIGYVQQEDDD